MVAQALPSFGIRTVETVLRDHHIYLYEFSEDMTDLLFLINSAVAGCDTLHFHMNNCGGDMHSGAQILHAIEEAMDCDIHVICYIEAICESMGAVFVARLITLGATVHIGKVQYLMFHNVSISQGSSTCTNVIRDAEETRKLYLHMLENYCRPLITDDEIARVIKGEEIYISCDVLIARIKSIIPEGETVH